MDKVLPFSIEITKVTGVFAVIPLSPEEETLPSLLIVNYQVVLWPEGPWY